MTGNMPAYLERLSGAADLHVFIVVSREMQETSFLVTRSIILSCKLSDLLGGILAQQLKTDNRPLPSKALIKKLAHCGLQMGNALLHCRGDGPQLCLVINFSHSIACGTTEGDSAGDSAGGSSMVTCRVGPPPRSSKYTAVPCLPRALVQKLALGLQTGSATSSEPYIAVDLSPTIRIVTTREMDVVCVHHLEQLPQSNADPQSRKATSAGNLLDVATGISKRLRGRGPRRLGGPGGCRRVSRPHHTRCCGHARVLHQHSGLHALDAHEQVGAAWQHGAAQPAWDSKVTQ